MRIGNGYDVHRLVPGRKLVIGGVEIPFELGLDGHSDADVLLHAISDALLGAAALGDIGKHFPPSDNSFKNIDSRILLRRVKKLLSDKDYRVVNVDATIVAQCPKMLPFIQKMVQNVAEDLDVDIGNINIKATTEEGLGFTGSGEGISAMAVCLIER